MRAIIRGSLWQRYTLKTRFRSQIGEWQSNVTYLRHQQAMNLSQTSASSKDCTRIHILGVGNIGRLFAHALNTSKDQHLITLLFHRDDLIEAWEDAGRRIEIRRDGLLEKSDNYDVEFIRKTGFKEEKYISATKQPSVNGQRHINNLIVATKAHHTARAISSIRDRLSPSSTILFTQNGMGITDEVSKTVFPDVSSRPNYLTCITSHGLFSEGQFRSIHAGKGTVIIGPAAQYKADGETWPLIDAIVNTPILAAREVSSTVLTLLQLEKLVVNAILNPLTAILRCQNGHIIEGQQTRVLTQLLLTEIHNAIQTMPEVKANPDLQERLSFQTMQAFVENIAKITASNRSSMLQDVVAERPTEIDYINNWIVKLGIASGVSVIRNQKLVELVKNRQVIAEADLLDTF